MTGDYGRYGELVRRLRRAVLEGAGETSPSLRRAVEARAGALSGRAAGRESEEAVPAALSSLVEKVAVRAYRVTAEDVAALRAAGYSEDELFEITASAALGAASARLERGLAALKGEV